MKGMPHTEFISGVSVAETESYLERKNKLVTILEATINLSADALLPTQTVSPPPMVLVSTTASVGIIPTKSTIDIDT